MNERNVDALAKAFQQAWGKTFGIGITDAVARDLAVQFAGEGALVPSALTDEEIGSLVLQVFDDHQPAPRRAFRGALTLIANGEKIERGRIDELVREQVTRWAHRQRRGGMMAKLYKLPDWLARWRDQIPAEAAVEMEEILGLTREGPNGSSSQQHSTGAA